jgi:tRNA A37 methylthiotransferase MiaB
MGEVVEQVRKLAAEGYREVVLTGVDVTSWGADLPGQPTLGQLVGRILKLVPSCRACGSPRSTPPRSTAGPDGAACRPSRG